MADPTRDAETVTPAADAAPAASVVVDGLPPENRTAGIVPDVPIAPPEAVVAGEPVPQSTAPKRGIRAMLPRRSGKLVVGLVLTLGIVLFSVVAPLFSQSPRATSNPAYLPPSTEHLLGTNNIGVDIFAQVAHGGLGSLTVGLLAGVIAMVLSLLFGIIAGYVGGWTNEILSFVTNIMLVIPGLPLIIVISAYLESRSLFLVALILGITGWAGAAIVLRAQARSLRSRDYVYAANVAGEKAPRIVLVEILPNLLPLLTANFLGAVLLAILSEAGLSYLGLGPSGSVTWGTILNEASTQNAMAYGRWWWFVPPGLLIALFGCGLALINFSIDEIINPKLRTAPAAVKNVRLARKQRAKLQAAIAPSTATAGTAGTAADTPARDDEKVQS
ncbi:ABC transporter permease [Cellulosimicrobium funkei]|uniref:ABC transporter permease n=1 Tax=Cellulosimicrobium funkei TaxID=264251 RepID=A0A4Y8R465_9MICO|nr:ABC transporter permease [Cellulosimicrobium funkei]TFF12845.1 ABC transporter permease [Cellulosimicrobium funkei]TGA77033.1 ABC transporter permease [Cellulosimicrobium terreum]